jgi:hypothetical protein
MKKKKVNPPFSPFIIYFSNLDKLSSARARLNRKLPKKIYIDYFSPKDSGSGKLTNLTKNTFSIHHFNGSWFSFQERTFRFISRWFGFRFAKMISNTYKKCFSYASVLFSIGIHSFSSDM